MPEIRQAFADDLIDEGFIDLPWIKQNLKEGRKKVLAQLRADGHYHYVEDTVRELEWWACFRPPPPPVPQRPPSPAPGVTARPAPPPQKKVGRNEPCPCGSGRKYKHCCGKPG